MTVPVSGLTNIIRSEVTDTFNSQVTDVVNAISKWSTSTTAQNAAPAPLPGIPGGWTQTNTVSSYSPASLNSEMLAGSTVYPAASVIAGLPLGNASYTVLGNLLINTSLVLSRCRNVNLKKYYQDDNSSNLLLFNVTNPAHMASLYQSSSLGVGFGGGDIDASSFNTFVSQLSAAVTAHRNTTLFFTEQWCHTSCHSSHSSRGRR